MPFKDSDLLYRGCPLKTVICYIEMPFKDSVCYIELHFKDSDMLYRGAL
jgi:hypothetical protein